MTTTASTAAFAVASSGNSMTVHLFAREPHLGQRHTATCGRTLTVGSVYCPSAAVTSLDDSTLCIGCAKHLLRVLPDLPRRPWTFYAADGTELRWYRDRTNPALFTWKCNCGVSNDQPADVSAATLEGWAHGNQHTRTVHR